MGESLEASVLTTALLVKLGVGRIVARASSELHERVLRAVGAHKVVDPERDYAMSLAYEVEAPTLRPRMVLETGHKVVEMEATEGLWGKTLQELDFRARFRLNVIAIRRRSAVLGPHGETEYREEINDLPSGGDLIRKGDILVVLGSDRNLARFQEEVS
jgi:trk system potassium uptake protein TrkA